MLDYDVYWQVNNYMFRPVAAIFRLLQFCSKSVIYIYIAQSVIYIYIFAQSVSYIYDTDFHRTVHGFFFWGSMPSHIVVDFVVLPPGHGRSVTDFWGWDAHEVRLRCSDDVSGYIGGCSARRDLKPKFYQPTQTMVTAGILPFRENSPGRAGNRTRDLMISRQRLWPLDHEAGLVILLL